MKQEDQERMALEVQILHFEGISTMRNEDSPDDVIDVIVKLKYFTYCCGEPHEQQDAIAAVIHLFKKEKE